MVSGGIELTFPGLILPGNAGMDVRIVRTYRSRSDSSQEWGLSFTEAPLSVLEYLDQQNAQQRDLVMSSGSKKKLHQSVVHPYWITTDFWRYDPTSRHLFLPDGRVARYEVSPNQAPATGSIIRLKEVEDPFGNKLGIFWTGSGSTALVDYLEQTVGGSNGNQTRTIDFCHNCGAGAVTVSHDNRTWTYTPSVIQPPTGPGWSFAYPGFDDGSDRAGTFVVTLPTGGTVAYEFIDNLSKSRLDRITTGGRAIDSGTWQFAFDANNPQTSTVTSSGGRVLTYKHQLYAGPEGSDWILREQSIADASGTLSTTSIDYEDVGFLPNKALKAVTLRSTSQGGITFTIDFGYDLASSFKDYLRPNSVTETASNQSSSRTTTFTYDYDFSRYIINKLGSQTVSMNGEAFTTSFGYANATGFLESVNEFGVAKVMGPDPYGNVGSITDADQHETTMSYAWGGQASVVTPRYAITKSINPRGQVVSHTQDGKTTTFEFDEADRPKKVITPDAVETVTDYAPDGSWAKVTRGAGWVRTDVDGFGRSITVENAVGVKVAFDFDEDGQKRSETHPHTATANTGKQFEYDSLGRLKKVTHSDGSHSDYAYPGATTNIVITNENGHSTTQQWEVLGQPSGGRLTAVTDPTGKTWLYSYDVLGSLTAVNSPDGAQDIPDRTWHYNSKHQLDLETHPESGTTEYTYHADGLLASRKDAEDRLTTFHYDGNHRLIAVLAPDALENATFSYDDRDNRTVMVTGGLRTEFDFDNANDLRVRRDWIEGRLLTTSYDYDIRGNLTKLTYPSGRAIHYGFDGADQITSVHNGAGQTYANNFQYHPNGQIYIFQRGNNITETVTLDGRDRPNVLTSGSLLSLDYDFDGVGNVSAITDGRGSSFSYAFCYDALDRLTHVSGCQSSALYSYDQHGNRLTKDTSAVTYQYSSLTNRLTSATSSFGVPEAGTFTYDDSGNMETDGVVGHQYVYTSDGGRMKSAKVAGVTTGYTYSADGIRAVKASTQGVRYYIYTGSQLLAEYDASSGVPRVIREYVYLGGKLLASFGDDPTQPAVASVLTAPAAGTVLEASVPVLLKADAAATAGATISSVQFYANAIYIGADSAAPFDLNWTPVLDGAYSLSSRAIASNGKVANSATATVTVLPIGRVLGVSVSTATPVQGQWITVTVTGNAYLCGAVQMDFGLGVEGQQVETFPHSGSLQSSPMVFQRRWLTNGVKNITASGQGNCKGSASPQPPVTVGTNSGPAVSVTATGTAQGKYITGYPVTLSATASDPQGVSRVEFYDGSTLLHTDTSAPWSYTWSATEGSHTLKAKAFDGMDVSSEATSGVTVVDIEKIQVSTPTLIGQPATVSVFGAATGCGAIQINFGDGDIVTYAIDGLSGPNGNGWSTTHTWSSGGQKSLTVTGHSDCSGTEPTTATLNSAPSVSLSTPADGSFFTPSPTVSMAATASDSDGSIAHVRFYAGATLLETDMSSPYSYSWSGMSNGTYSITAIATDNQGATTTSSAASINIGTPPASTVTGVSADVSSAGTYVWVAVTVTGGNPCGAVQINFGDNQAPYLPISQLPYTTYHYWDTPGTYWITANGQGNCSGQAASPTPLIITGEGPMTASIASPSQFVFGRTSVRGEVRRTRRDRASALVPVSLEGDSPDLSPDVARHVSYLPVTLTLDIAPGASGTIMSSPAGFNCSGQDISCSASFEAGTVVTLTATPGSGHTFAGWGGACTGQSTCVVSAISGRLVIAAFASPGTLRYYHSDILGSVRVITDASGALVTRHDYQPFGESISPPTGDPRRFLGLERDSETGFDYAEARFYRNVWARFTSPDPVLDGTSARIDPQRWNRYSYGLNNPLRYRDTDGKNPFAILGAAGAVVFGGWQIAQNLSNDRPWYENVGAEAGKGLIVGATLGLAAPALTTAKAIPTAATALEIGLLKNQLHQAMTSGTSPVEIVTKLTQAPAVGRALSAAGGENAQALANAARSSGQIFTATIPQAVLKLLENRGLLEIRIVQMNGVTGREYRFAAEAMKFLAPYFH